MKIALVHDFFTQRGGADNTFKILAQAYPKADIFTLVSDEKIQRELLGGRKPRTSFLQKIPGGIKNYQWFMVLMPFLVEQFNLDEYDLVLSSSSFFMKGLITRPETLHINYCHTPPRFLWHYSQNYLDEIARDSTLKKIIPRFIVNHFIKNIRRWDLNSSARVDHYIANSKTVQRRIKKYYNRSARVINPPVEIGKFSLSPNKKNYYLIGGRLVAHKKFDLAVEAFSTMPKRNLIIFGSGPEEKNLKKKIKPLKNIKFLGYISNQTRSKLMSQAKAFLYPQEEDFGITAVESLASGTPVIAYFKGGAKETIQNRVSGIFYKDNSSRGLAKAIEELETLNFNARNLQEIARKYDSKTFASKIKTFVEKKYQEHQKQFLLC